MGNVTVVGAQWGDEGKGKIVDWLSERADVVVAPWALLDEIDKLKGQGVPVSPDNLKLADNAALILPLHRDLDALREDAKAAVKIGTTRRGIGPAYEDKVGRRGIRLCD